MASISSGCFPGIRTSDLRQPDEKALDFLAGLGFNFVRIPLTIASGPPASTTFTRISPSSAASITTWKPAGRAAFTCLLNLHRAPGYCTDRNDLEQHNLWMDDVAQNAFVFLWETFARRYRDVPGNALSFDLINEPPSPGQYWHDARNHAALIRRTVAAIRAIHEDREIVIDGLGGGYLAMPELAHLGVTHSGRGYHPMPVSHHKAPWWADQARAPEPKYPGLRWQGRSWDRAASTRFLQSWREVEKRGAKIHIGEFGCFRHTPDDIAIRWMTDLLGVFKEFDWGYALWQFQGPFGIIEHGRPGARYRITGRLQRGPYPAGTPVGTPDLIPG